MLYFIIYIICGVIAFLWEVRSHIKELDDIIWPMPILAFVFWPMWAFAGVFWLIGRIIEFVVNTINSIFDRAFQGTDLSLHKCIVILARKVFK